MNKKELIEAVATRSGMTRQQAAQAVGQTLDALTDALQKQEKVRLSGFGTFEPKLRPAHTGRNPQTSAPMEIPAHATVCFRPASALRDAMED